MKPPEIKVESDWEEFELPFDIGSGRSMFVETEKGPTLRMKFFRKKSDSSLVGRVWFAQAAFGPPGHAHGGIISFVLDEAMGSCAWMKGYPSVAANLQLDFREMTPIEKDLTIEAHVKEVERTKLFVKGHISLEGKTLVEAQGLFVRLSKEKLVQVSKEAGVPVPHLDSFHFE